MSLKSIVVLLLLFSTQLLISCIFNPCDCDPGREINVMYTTGDLIPLDTSGFDSDVVTDSTHRNSFALYYQTSFNETEISERLPSPSLSGFGFNAAFACSCVGDTYMYNDPIIDVSIVIVNDETKEETNGDLAFGYYSYNELQTLDRVDWSSIFNQDWYPEAYLNFELIDENAVASSSVFEIVLRLESGATLTSQTEVVKFFD